MMKSANYRFSIDPTRNPCYGPIFPFLLHNTNCHYIDPEPNWVMTLLPCALSRGNKSLSLSSPLISSPRGHGAFSELTDSFLCFI